MRYTSKESLGYRAAIAWRSTRANRWEWIVAYWATITIGALPALFNGYWTADETAHAIQLSIR